MTPMRPPQIRLYNEVCVDLFAGGGGTSTGIEAVLGRPPDIAINHDPIALAMHKANHPTTKHLKTDVFDADPVAVCEGQRCAFAWFSPDCFPAGTLILTTRGYRPIEEIESGELVLTHQGRYRRVTETTSTQRALVTVRGQGHPGLSVSAEHPFYARSVCNVWNNERRAYDRQLQEPEWVRAADLRTVGAPMNAAGGDLSFWATPSRFPERPIPPIHGRGMQIDEALMWLAGRYVGDGWTRFTETRAELVITCDRAEADELRLKLDQWPRSGERSGYNELAWHERETTTAYQFTADHHGLVEWLRAEFGHGALRKSIPAWALGMETSMRAALLEGYLSADGHARQISGSDVHQASTVSKALAFSLRALAESLDYSVNVNGPYENRCEIDGRHVNAACMWTVKWREELQRAQNVRDELHNWTRVRAVEDEDRTATVFNLSVDEDESYVAEGVVVHNCTYHSKARGGKPFRDRNRARRVRGLAWVMVKWAESKVKPRILFMENVEEIAQWGPLDAAGVPDPKRKGQSWRKLCARIRRAGYQLEVRELRASPYGAPTSRKRLFLIARCDGAPIVWPVPTHGPTQALPYATAAECIDFSLAVPSIFMNKRQAKTWGRLHGVPSPRRPLAKATLRRIARGIQRFVLDAPEPFIVSNLTHNVPRPVSEPLSTVLTGNHKLLVTPFLAKYHAPTSEGGERGQGLDEPIKTLDTANRFALVAPFLAPVLHQGDDRVHPVDEPMRTITSAPRGEFALVTPLLMNNSELRGDRVYRPDEPIRTLTAMGCRTMQLLAPTLAPFITEHANASEQRNFRVDEPLRTICAGVKGGHFALVAPTLINTRNGERKGQAPRALDITQPMPTVTAQGSQGALVAAFLAKHNGGHEATGQKLTRPMDTVVCRENKAFVSTHLMKLRGGEKDHKVTASDLRDPVPTITAGGTHLAAVSAFLLKYYGTKKDGSRLDAPLDTIVTKERYGLVTVMIAGEEYAIVDIGMRMLTPRELFTAQGFPADYEIDRVTLDSPLGIPMPVKLTKQAQTKLVGNSVPPHVAAALIGANLAQTQEVA